MAWEPPLVGTRATWTRTIGSDDVEAFARISGDRNSLHFDPEFAARTRMERLIVQGGLTTALFNALVAMELPGPGSVFLHQEWDYPAPVYVGDTVTAEAVVIEARPDKPITRLRCVARRQDGVEVLRGECLVYTMQPDGPVQQEAEAADRWRILAIVAVGVLLAMAPWFSASAVATPLVAEWQLDRLGLPTLTIAVQVGFAFGALALAATAAADVIPARFLFGAGALIAAAANAGFAFVAGDLASAVPFRLATGLAIAGVYPVGLKLLAGWFRAERGFAIGVLVGALTIGSALPYLLRAVGASQGLDWRATVGAASVAAVLGGLLVFVAASRGPWDAPAPRFSLDVARSALREPGVRLANLGYLGHMWELYAMWTWVPLFLAASFAAAGTTDPATASAAAFAVVASGGIGCVAAGLLADRLGRTTLTIAAMAASGTAAIAAGFAFGAVPALTIAIAIVWGVTVVADSAQFSTAVSELAPPGTAGSALAVQMALGFLLTGLTILAVGWLDPGDGSGWRVAFVLLALGPAVGIVAMWRLRQRPEAVRMASGHR